MKERYCAMVSSRGNRARYCGIAIVVLSISFVFSYLLYFEGDENYGVAIYLLLMSILAMFLGELLRRACLLAEEVWHMRERYNSKLGKLFRKVFSSNDLVDLGVSAVLIILTLWGVHYFYNHNKEAISAEGGRYFLLLFQNIAIVPIVGYLAGIREPTAVEKAEINERYNKNLADGLAWSYYFGYLKLILPNLDQAVRRAPAMIRENLDPVKLFILIPESCYCPKTFDDEYIKMFANFRVLSINRGGVHNRSYDQTVYEITIPENLPGNEMYVGTYYCLAQYATPLLTLYDMSRHQSAQLSEEERLSQVRLFYKKLKGILDQDDECRGKYELFSLPDKSDRVSLEIVKQIKNAPVQIAN